MSSSFTCHENVNVYAANARTWLCQAHSEAQCQILNLFVRGMEGQGCVQQYFTREGLNIKHLWEFIVSNNSYKNSNIFRKYIYSTNQNLKAATIYTILCRACYVSMLSGLDICIEKDLIWPRCSCLKLKIK